MYIKSILNDQLYIGFTTLLLIEKKNFKRKANFSFFIFSKPYFPKNNSNII